MGPGKRLGGGGGRDVPPSLFEAAGYRLFHLACHVLGRPHASEIQLEIGMPGGSQLLQQLPDLSLGEPRCGELFGTEGPGTLAHADSLFPDRGHKACNGFELAPTHDRAGQVVVDPGLVGERGDALDDTRHDLGEGPDLPLRVRVNPEGQKVQKIVEIDLPVPLGIGRERKVDAGQFPGNVLFEKPA
jgi:hypothetical protein